MKVSYSVVIGTACRGTRATNTSWAAVATAASVEAPGGAGTEAMNGSRPPSVAATAS